MGPSRLTRRNVLKSSGLTVAALLSGRKGDSSQSVTKFEERTKESGDQNRNEEDSAPPNLLPELHAELSTSSVILTYHGEELFSGHLHLLDPSGKKSLTDAGVSLTLSDAAVSDNRYVSISVQEVLGDRNAREGLFHFEFAGADKDERLELDGVVSASEEAFSAETMADPQIRFPLIRTSSGRSRNLRNNAIYDRRFDWVISGPADGSMKIESEGQTGGPRHFRIRVSGNEFALSFRPRYYQKHRNISFFEPWRYRIWEEPVQGWCSWWAYFDKIDQQTVRKIADIFGDKLLDYGYSYIQIDDGYQRAPNGTIQDFLSTNSKFPDGLAALANYISSRQLKPGIWVSSEGNAQDASKHPEWFIPGADGKPFKGPWIGFGINGAVPEAVDQLVRPLYRQLREQRWQYVKIDTLRHLLYDMIYQTNDYFTKIDFAPAKAFRNILWAAREELGNDTYLLACWGVLPEAVGIANSCRLGGDGFGPSTLTEFNSWNNVVWRNDPDHVDLSAEGEEIIRPVVISMAGAQMMLSDKAEFYENNSNLEGARRSSPVLFTEPGQLYDFNPVRTENLLKGLRNANGGQFSGPLDGDQWGVYCPWWLMEIERTFEHWFVLAHMSWEPLPEARVQFADLGLPRDREYVVYEFWSKEFLGVFNSFFNVPALEARGTKVYSIRTMENRPQIISTNRHISQGGVDLVDVSWSDSANTLCGTSDVVRSDRYEIALRVPKGYRFANAKIDGRPAEIGKDPDLTRVSTVPEQTKRVSWKAEFVRTALI